MAAINPGILYSVTASIAFAAMPAYLQLMPPVNGYVVVGQRILWTTLIVTLILLVSRRFRKACIPLARPRQWPGLVAGSALVGVQWALFVWAPLHGETLGLALGYFLLPLVLVLVGRFFLSEKVSRVQWSATTLGALGVASSLWFTASFSWVALVVALGYPVYFQLRRYQPISVLSAFFIENLMLVPLAWWICLKYGDIRHPFAYSASSMFLFFGVGLLGTLGMLALLSASRRLPVVTFGLMGYLEPPLILAVGMFGLGEVVPSELRLTYLLICTAIALLALDGLRHTVSRRNRIP